MVIGIDFDGTCVTHEYPGIGKGIGAEKVMAELVEEGHQLILFTMRSGKELQKAVDWFAEWELPLYGVNVNPHQHKWTSSPKAYCHLYIDDAALGIPLLYPGGNQRPFVNWARVKQLLQAKAILPTKKSLG